MNISNQTSFVFCIARIKRLIRFSFVFCFLRIKRLIRIQLQIISLFVPKPLVEERDKLIKEIAIQFGLKEKLVEERNKLIKEIDNQFKLDWILRSLDEDTTSSLNEDKTIFTNDVSM